MNQYKIFCISLLLISLFVSNSFAQDDLPIVGIIKIGSLRPIDLAEQGILDVFEAYDYENGENIEIRQVDAGGDVSFLASTVEVLLSEGVDIIMPIQAAAISATMDIVAELVNPPAVIFSVIQNPYVLGLAEDACTKPTYFTGQSSGAGDLASQALFESIRELDPELNSIAFVYNSNDPGAIIIKTLFETTNEDFGFTLMSQAVTSGEEVVPVIESLLVAGAESILVLDATSGSRIAELSALSVQASVPLFAVDAGVVYLGATLGVGSDFYQLGVNAGRMAVAYLEGNLDLATTAISDEIIIIRAFNLDLAVEQNLIAPDGFVDSLNFYIEDGLSTELEPSLPDLSLDELRVLDAEFLDSLQCPETGEATEAAGN